MQIACVHRIQRILWLVTILIPMCCIGCFHLVDVVRENPDEPSDGDSLDDSWIVAEMHVKAVEVRIAESTPAQVIVEVIGWLPDSCTSRHETHQSREGNTVTIRMTTKRPKDSVCATVVTEIREQVLIGTFPPGDYVVIVNQMKQEFRVD